MADTIPGFLKTLTEWVVSVSQWFDGWDITLLVPALIILTVIAGVTGRAAVGPRLWMQLVWGTVTVIFGLIEVAIIWTIIARYLPVADMGTLTQNMLQRKPLLVNHGMTFYVLQQYVLQHIKTVLIEESNQST